MSTNRAALLTKIHKALKKHYAHLAPRGEQPLLESLLYATCLENNREEVADKVFHSLKTSFFDWNEVRVTTVRELAEVMAPLEDASVAAAHLKSVLQTVFESEYSFEIEAFKKQNIGQAVKQLQKIEGATPFSVAYATQRVLGGHSIPLDRGALQALFVLGAATQAEVASGAVAGLERAIPKSKGQEFGALLHAIGADFVANPFSSTLRDFVLSIVPDAKDRLPKRGVKKPEPEPPKKKVAEKAPEKAAAPVEAKKKELRAGMAAPKNGPPPKNAVPAKPAAARKPAPPKPPKKSAPPEVKKKVLAKRKPR